MNEANAPTSEIVTRPLVLVVDDDPGVLEALSSLLSPRIEPLYQLETAASAEEALEIVAANDAGPDPAPVALVIADERMPGKSGTELLAALRQHVAHRYGGRILITAYAGLSSAKRAINEAEVDRYFPKPWKAEEGLLPAVGSILARFSEQAGLDQYLEAAQVTSTVDRRTVIEVRMGWWEYLTLYAGGVGNSALESPNFDEPEDDDTIVFLARRQSPRGNRAAGTIRYRPLPGTELTVLDQLAFMPEAAGDDTERLLLHTVVIDTAFREIPTICTQAPVLRRDIYEALGFTEHPEPPPARIPGTVWMGLHPTELKVPQAFVARYRQDQRLCSCSQKGCPTQDYALERRGYYCPLDLQAGRAPRGFPGGAGR